MYPAYEVSHFVDPKAENYTAVHTAGVFEGFVVQDFPASQSLHAFSPYVFA
jgi:hypothetical protein